MSSVRGPVNWIGGKGILYRHILPLLPRGKIYVEPFAGGASVFWRMEPMDITVLNDLDGEIVNFYRVLQDPVTFAELSHRLHFTLFSREEFRKALSIKQGEPVDRAWAFFVRQNQAFGGDSPTCEGNWKRNFTSTRGMSSSISTWLGKIECLDIHHAKLRTAQIESKDALEVIQYWDRDDTVFYIDPPYVHSTRKDKAIYSCELDDSYHRRLVDVLLDIKGAAVLSGYDHEIYSRLMESGWQKKEIKTVCHVVKGKDPSRVEVLWVKNTGR